MKPFLTVRSVPDEPYTQTIETGSHTLMADKRHSEGGSDLGPGPYSYLLAALGT